MTSYFQLSQQQNRIWSLQNGSDSFAVQGSLTWKGPLDHERLKNSVTQLEEGKDILRTVFKLKKDDGLPVQMLQDNSKTIFDYQDISHLKKGERSTKIYENKRNAKDFDSAVGHCIARISVFKVAESDFELTVTLPALSTDSYSLIQWVQNLLDLYLGREPNKEVISYRQFSQWQNQLMNDSDEDAAYFWQQYLLGKHRPCTIPFQGTGILSETSRRETESTVIDKALKKRLEGVLKKSNASKAGFMMTCLAILVRKYNIADHVTIANVATNRKYKELFPTHGVIAKTLPIKGEINLDDSLRNVLKQWQKTIEDTGAWSEYLDYTTLQNEKGASSTSFAIGFEYIDLSLSLPSSPETQCEWNGVDSTTDSFAIKLTCVDLGDQFQIVFTYDSAQFTAFAVQSILQHYMNLLSEFTNTDLDTVIGAVTIHSKEEEERITSTGTYILDKEKKVRAIGVPGEIYIAKDLVSKGNQRKVKLDKDTLVKNPFDGDGTHMIHTGDRGRWLPDGTIDYLGRNDIQLKINGNKVDFKIVENSLLSYDTIQEVALMYRESMGDSEGIVAFVTADKTIDFTLLKAFLTAELPTHMIPAFYKQLGDLPLTIDGKVDMGELAGMELTDIQKKTDRKPKNEIEKEIRAIWIEVLGLRKIGVRDKFFDLGGHSIKAVKIASKINEKLNVLISLDALLDNASIEDLARMVDGSETVDHQSIQPLEEQEYYDVSYAQARLWILDKLETNKIIYNISQAILLKGPFNREVFNKTMQTIVCRHESLRTNFISIDNVPKQRIKPISELNFKVDYVDLRNESQAMGEVLLRADKEANTPFDLEKSSLFRVRILQISEEEHVLFFTLHHIITDAWSLGVLTNEIAGVYNAYCAGMAPPLADLKLQYKEYAVWQKEQLEGESLQVLRQYWLDKLKLFPEKINLKTDFSRPKAKKLTGRHMAYVFDENLTQELNGISQANQLSLFTVLLSSMYTLFYKMTNQEDIVLGTSVAGRDHVDLEGQVGFFVNLLALRTQFRGDEAFTSLLEKAKDTTLGAFSHQVYPFDKLVEDMDIERRMNQSPLFDILIVFQNTEITKKEIALNGLDVENLGGGVIEKCEFDIIFNFHPTEKGIFLNIHYSDELYEDETILIMVKKLELIFQTVVVQPQVKLLDISIELEEEKELKENRVSLDFNF